MKEKLSFMWNNALCMGNSKVHDIGINIHGDNKKLRGTDNLKNIWNKSAKTS